ncbi:UV-endonuclease UvdE-domain-containing protein [Lyophyllum atratum]|nr:UV-endonuclease UvdE-domain-containing protein [Lyophyllum atratum]
MAATRRSARLALNANLAMSSREKVSDGQQKRKRGKRVDLEESHELPSPPHHSRTATEVETSDESFEITKAHRKKRQAKAEPIYVIPDVETKTTAFKGRLGYACLNTVLRNRKPSSESVLCSRTCRLDSLKKKGLDWVKDLGRKNVEDLLTMMEWNEENHIRFLRLSSEMFPFASHAVHGYSLEYCAPLLARVGSLANRYGHRLTAHPGQYTQLGSPKPEVIQSAVRELSYHCEMLDRMGVGVDGVMIVHGGGMYEDKIATLARIRKTITDILPEGVRHRLALENDEICYNAEDLLPLCEELDVPFIFDYHHDALYPSSIPPKVIIERANAIFARRRIRPKQHLSEPRPGAVTLMERRAHADRCENLPLDLPDDMDLMIEVPPLRQILFAMTLTLYQAKDKEQAVLHLYRMYNLHPVHHASLRPPDENQTKQTKGRKSNKRLRSKAEELCVNVEDELAMVIAHDCDKED